jgi:serine/threonine protein kinase
LNTPEKTCDIERLRLLLADQLPEPTQSELAEHVAACEKCRQALENFAGDAGWWSDVATCFRANADQASGATSSHAEAPRPDESFTADFVVDFLAPTDQPEALGRLGEYEILEVIGRGGMGVVLKGFQRELGRYVAVKVMAPHLAASGAARRRFVREARAAAAIMHPNVMPIHTVCTTGRLPYLVMPYIACESLQQRIDRQGPLDVQGILRIGMQTAAGLAAAHAQGLVHRDVKPANILLEIGVDRVMLTDFGLARAADDGSLTRTGVVSGTPQYMSPEQARGESIDARSDLFSLGSVFYAMCCGRPPFRAETPLGILRRISDTQPRAIREVNPEIPDWLERIVRRLHEKLPAERFENATAVAEILERCLAHVQQPTVTPLPDSLLPAEAPTRSRFGKWTKVGVGSAMALVAALAIAWPIVMRPGETEVQAPANPTPSASVVSDDELTRDTARFADDLDAFEKRALQTWDAMPNP